MLRKPIHLFKRIVQLNYDAIVSHRERKRALSYAPAYWETLTKQVFEEHQPVFVLSTGRCGTELLTNLFSSLPQVSCFHAPKPELLTTEKIAFEMHASNPSELCLAIRAARFELIADCVIRNRRYVETNYRITFFAEQLASLFRRVKFIHLVRDPGDFVRSAVNRKYYVGQYTDLGRITPVSAEVKNQWNDMSSIEKCSWLWNATNEFIEDFKAKQPEDMVLTIRSEDLFAKTEAFASIVEFCELPALQEKKISAMILNRINAQTPSATDLPHVSRWSFNQLQQLRAWTPLAAHYGYER